LAVYEMLTGEHMFNEIAEDTEEVLQYIRSLDNDIDINLKVSKN